MAGRRPRGKRAEQDYPLEPTFGMPRARRVNVGPKWLDQATGQAVWGRASLESAWLGTRRVLLEHKAPLGPATSSRGPHALRLGGRVAGPNRTRATSREGSARRFETDPAGAVPPGDQAAAAVSGGFLGRKLGRRRGLIGCYDRRDCRGIIAMNRLNAGWEDAGHPEQECPLQAGRKFEKTI